MTNIVLIAILACGVGIIALLGVLAMALATKIRFYESVARQLYESIASFITPPSDGQPSALSLMADRYAMALARAFSAQIKTQIMGELSGQARAALAAKGEADVAEAQTIPLMPNLMQAIPALTGNLKRGKAGGWLDIARLILPALANRGSSNSGVPRSNGHSSMTLT